MSSPDPHSPSIALPSRVVFRSLRLDGRTASDRKWEGRFQEGDTVTQVGPFYTYEKLPAKQLAMLQELGLYYTEERLRRLVHEIEHGVALRLYDWLVTNYSKEHRILRIIETERGSECVDVHEYYTSWRWALRKRYFDFFAKRIKLFFDLDGHQYTTAVTQLNIFRFADKLDLVSYIHEHFDAIAKHNEQALQRRNERKRSGQVKRGELSHAPPSRCTLAYYPVLTPTALYD